MERAELRLGPGLNTLTGETGAGKTLLAHALDLLLGGKARSGIVRQGAAEAYVEGVFELPPELVDGGDERIPDGAEELVLARRVWPDGRTRAYVCGRSATVADLREFGSRLISFYGQHEHRKLMLSAAQLDALDAYCGAEQGLLRLQMKAAHERVKSLETRIAELDGLVGARDRELDLLGFELREIEDASPSEDEECELVAERDRLRNQEALRLGASVTVEAVSPEEGEGVGAMLARAVSELENAAQYDAELAPMAERLSAVRFEAEDIAGDLRGYLEGIDAAPGRLQWVEERLAVFARLARKHGGSIAEVMAHAERCRERKAELEAADVQVADLSGELEAALAERERLADELSGARAKAAPQLASAVLERLAELSMPDASFEVVLGDRDDGYGVRGRDTVEFRIAPNAGLPAGPLKEVASGGELSRVMLSLLSVAHGGTGEGGDGSGGDGSLLVFDEIDAGIGGHTARAVGKHLRALSRGRQVLCITHLPQVAAMAERHFTIVKDGSQTPARTTVTALSGNQVVAELVRMLGADDGDRAARGHARELLKAA